MISKRSLPVSLKITIPCRYSLSYPVFKRTDSAVIITPYESIMKAGPLNMDMCFKVIDMILEDLPMALSS
jgi:hypothetical protein